MPVIESPSAGFGLPKNQAYRSSAYRKRAVGSHRNIGECAVFCGSSECRSIAITSFVDFSARQRQTYGFSLRTRDRPGRCLASLEVAAGEAETTESEAQLMTVKQVSYTFESTLETINHVEEQASRMAASAGFSEDDVMSIAMAVREAAVNAVLHGNAYDPGKKVTLAFEQNDKDLTIVVRDQGKG